LPVPPTPPLICLVDPDPATQRSVRAALVPRGAEVRTYRTAEQFLAALAQPPPPACVIADAHLPDMSGLALLGELRARGHAMPVILLSSDADVQGAVEAMRAGAVDFIEKPFIDRALVTQVAPILDVDASAP
jgi:FixJ family two-component response regulator